MILRLRNALTSSDIAKPTSAQRVRPIEGQFLHSPTQRKVVFCLGGWSERMCAMIRKVSNVEFVVPTVFAVALAIVLSIGAIYLTEILLGPIEPVEAHQSVAGNCGITELPNPDGRLSRVHLLLSGMK